MKKSINAICAIKTYLVLNKLHNMKIKIHKLDICKFRDGFIIYFKDNYDNSGGYKNLSNYNSIEISNDGRICLRKPQSFTMNNTVFYWYLNIDDINENLIY